jgi:hypothetical protein
VRTIGIPSARNTSSKNRDALGLAVTDQESEAACAVARVEHQVAGLLGHPSAGWVRGHAQDLDAPGDVLDDGEAVQPVRVIVSA